jgi:hypothetical protein
MFLMETVLAGGGRRRPDAVSGARVSRGRGSTVAHRADIRYIIIII